MHQLQHLFDLAAGLYQGCQSHLYVTDQHKNEALQHLAAESALVFASAANVNALSHQVLRPLLKAWLPCTDLWPTMRLSEELCQTFACAIDLLASHPDDIVGELCYWLGGRRLAKRILASSNLQPTRNMVFFALYNMSVSDSVGPDMLTHGFVWNFKREDDLMEQRQLIGVLSRYMARTPSRGLYASYKERFIKAATHFFQDDSAPLEAILIVRNIARAEQKLKIARTALSSALLMCLIKAYEHFNALEVRESVVRALVWISESSTTASRNLTDAGIFKFCEWALAVSSEETKPDNLTDLYTVLGNLIVMSPIKDTQLYITMVLNNTSVRASIASLASLDSLASIPTTTTTNSVHSDITQLFVHTMQRIDSTNLQSLLKLKGGSHVIKHTLEHLASPGAEDDDDLTELVSHLSTFKQLRPLLTLFMLCYSLQHVLKAEIVSVLLLFAL